MGRLVEVVPHTHSPPYNTMVLLITTVHASNVRKCLPIVMIGVASQSGTSGKFLVQQARTTVPRAKGGKNRHQSGTRRLSGTEPSSIDVTRVDPIHSAPKECVHQTCAQSTRGNIERYFHHDIRCACDSGVHPWLVCNPICAALVSLCAAQVVRFFHGRIPIRVREKHVCLCTVQEAVCEDMRHRAFRKLPSRSVCSLLQTSS